MKRLNVLILTMLLASSGLWAQNESPKLDQAAQEIGAKLEGSLQEFSALQAAIAADKIPLNQRMADLEEQLAELRSSYQKIARKRDKDILSLSNLRKEILGREEESLYLSNLLGEYVRNFSAGLHIAERPQFETELQAAELAPRNANLSDLEIFQAQASLIDTALLRLSNALGGTRFEGTAVDQAGQVRRGNFVLVGPTAVFSSSDGSVAGLASERLGSLEPTVFPFGNPLDKEAAAGLASSGTGIFPFDPTLGNAQKMEATEESLWEHVQKGGPVMIPIFVMAAIALLIALFKWVSFSALRSPSSAEIKRLHEAVSNGDAETAMKVAQKINGPVGKMLAAGAEHMREPRELIEEVMYEILLTTRLRLQRFLPFVAISAASAPLLGLLGTVTGIINTFKMITVFGSGDVKSLSGGISEALITTKFGLIVAIPSLLIHAFLSRKARSVVAQMETSAMGLVNHISLGDGNQGPSHSNGGQSVSLDPDPKLVRKQVQEILADLLGPLKADEILQSDFQPQVD